jgi:hypothetical protein
MDISWLLKLGVSEPATPVVIFSGEKMIPEETRNLVDAVVLKDALRELFPTITRLCNRPSAA